MRKISVILSVLTALTIPFLYKAPLLGASLSFPPPDPTSQPDVPQIAVSITLRGEEQPTYHIVSDNLSQEQRVHATPTTLHFPGQPPSSSAQLLEAGPDAITADLIDNWDLLLEEDFEGIFPQGPCAAYDGSNDGFDRTWDEDDFRPFDGFWAGWPANGGANGVDPAVSDYPANLDSWLICGPFDLSDAQDFLVRFTRWLEVNDADDFFFVGASTDGTNYSGLAWHGISNWVTYHVWFQGVGGDNSV